jgi:hypothetical protein
MVMSEVLKLMLTWTGLIVFGAFIMNFVTMGLPMKVLNVRASMGKKIIVHIYSMTGVYYKTGVIDGDFLVYRARHDKRNERRRIDLRKAEHLLRQSVIFRSWGVANVAVDEATNAVRAVDFSTVQPHDAIKVDHLIKRALMAPKIQDKKDVVIIVLLIVVLLMLIFVAYKTNANTKLILSLTQQIGTVTPAVS